MNNSNVIPFAPAGTGDKGNNQKPLQGDDYLTKNDLHVLTFPHQETCEAITLAIMLHGKQVTQRDMWFNLDGHHLSRLAAYIHNLKKSNWWFIQSERLHSRDFQPWHYGWESRAKIDPDFDYVRKEEDKVVKRWSRYYLPQPTLDAWRSMPECEHIFEWAEDTFHLWGGDYSGIDAWNDAET